LLDACTTSQNDQVSKRDRLAAKGCAVELVLDTFESVQHFRQFGRLVDFPILLGCEANSCAVRTATLVGATEGGC
jgi:hypothetical protein